MFFTIPYLYFRLDPNNRCSALEKKIGLMFQRFYLKTKAAHVTTYLSLVIVRSTAKKFEKIYDKKTNQNEYSSSHQLCTYSIRSQYDKKLS